ncbi:MAG: YkuS family protein [Bacillota bacterium]
MGRKRGDTQVKGIIAVADTLSDYRDMLEEHGYQVVGLEEGIDVADAVVVSGIDMDQSGVSAINTEAPVFDVTGKNPEEVLHDIEEHLELM